MHIASTDIVLKTFAALDLTSVALLLDVDGTLIDIGPTPAQVHVPDDLCESLSQLGRLTSGATALVSGRPIADLDRLFSPLKLSVIGAHGAQMRIAGREIWRGIDPLPAALRAGLADGAPAGVIVEDKGFSVALHFRQVPKSKAAVRTFVEQVCREFSEESVTLLAGKAVLELRRTEVNKGEGVLALMNHPPFRGRVPVFIGDDVTDEDVFNVLPHTGGLGYSVGRKFPDLAGMFHSPGDVRDALASLARSGGSHR